MLLCSISTGSGSSPKVPQPPGGHQQNLAPLAYMTFLPRFWWMCCHLHGTGSQPELGSEARLIEVILWPISGLPELAIFMHWWFFFELRHLWIGNKPAFQRYKVERQGAAAVVAAKGQKGQHSRWVSLVMKKNKSSTETEGICFTFSNFWALSSERSHPAGFYLRSCLPLSAGLYFRCVFLSSFYAF